MYVCGKIANFETVTLMINKRQLPASNVKTGRSGLRMFKKIISISHLLCTVSSKSSFNLAQSRCPAFISALKMSSSSLECLPKVDIDPSGVFKYILLKVHDPAKDSEESSITIVRGYQRCNYHSDIYDEVQATIQPLDAEPLGGGRISHDPENKKLHIYGYSQGYGKADHEVTASLIKQAYPEYKITVSDEGY